MYLGQLVEIADSTELCAHPLHPYTQALLTAALPAHPDDKHERLADHRRGSERAGAAVRVPLSHALSARHAALRGGRRRCAKEVAPAARRSPAIYIEAMANGAKPRMVANVELR